MSLRLRSSLPTAHSVDYSAMKRNGFHDQGILVVDVNDPMLPWPDRELLKQIGERLYGKPRTRPTLRLANGRAG